VKLALVVVLGAVFVACGSDDGGGSGPNPAPVGKPWKTLDEWRLFADARAQIPAEGVEAYGVVSPLFSDYTAKYRFFWLPEGEKITYRDEGAWELPLGAIAIKTFAYPVDARDPTKGERIVETRLLVREATGWVPHTYIWNEAQTEAVRQSAGDIFPVSWIDETGTAREHDYVVPNTNECQECHGKPPANLLLGLRTGQIEGLSGERLIDRWAERGLFASTPTPAASRPRYPAPDDTSASLSTRARAYLEANCAHCHNPNGDASSKALYLDFAHTDPDTQDPINWGVCKVPTSAGGATCGYTYDIVPGDSDRSVMICRMLSTVGADQMPPLGRGLVHVEGVALVRAWIDAMEPDDCH
jgi:uncharacterized repeat protein (TIGR03806 family)